ncbi:unnamed protein product [Orchesella dallaii]|uniref:RecQ-mediated genome instability protein 1 n=1 Tax=Orchesella dallaii TaxID=48710 RepID=A0ABP1QI22_9HEXA
MGISDSELRALKKFLKDSSFTYTDEWLLACVDWILENNTNVNAEVLRREIFEQWKDANLEDMESSCLPSNLKDQRSVKLPGKYGLQVNSVRDIGESSYNQWNKVKKLENENTSVAATDSTEFTQTWQPKQKRCLHLTMTDGSQQVFGLEMQPIIGLTINMKPGVKVIVIGPVDCRRGIIHLKPNNIKVIGGEVEDFKDTNKMERILANILNITDNKLTQTQTRAQPRTAPPPQTRTQPVSTVSNTNQRNCDVVGDFPDSDDPFNGQDDALFADDDLFMEIDEEALLRSASNSNVTTQAVSSLGNVTQRTTQRVGESFSTGRSFTEEIEDYDDESATMTSNMRPPASTTNTNARSIANSRPIVSTSVSSTSTKANPVFMPPPPVPKSSTSVVKQSNASSTAMSSTSLKNSMQGKSSTSTPSTSNEKTVVGPTAFRSAKTAVTGKSKASSSNSGASGTQKKILHYMKPMPVVIDPPTPEREAKRRKKSGEEDTKVKMEVDVEETSMQDTEFVTMEEQAESMTMNILDEGDQNDASIEEEFFNHSPDISLMQIVDEAIESRLSMALDAEQTSSKTTPASSSLVSGKVYPIRVSERPYVFLMQVQEKYEELAERRKIVYVKGCISTVVSNIQVDNGCWTLSVSINDGTGYLNCKISANILDNIIGFTPQEMKRIKSAKSPEGKAKISEGMGGLVKKLVHMNAIFAIELGEDPLIIEIVDIMLHHSTAIKDRLRQLQE